MRGTRVTVAARLGSDGLSLGDQFLDAVRNLGSLAGPMIDAVALEQDGGGVGAGIVGADYFDGAAVAGAVLFNDDYAIVGLLAGAKARQTNHDHGKSFQTLPEMCGEE